MATHDAYLVFSHKKTITLSFTGRHKVQNQPPNSHDTPAFIKPIRKRYFPPHHRSHQPNPLQPREQTHHPNSNETCTRCNSVPVPTPFPHPVLTPKYTHLRPTAPTIPFYGYTFCVLLEYYTIIYVPLNVNSPKHTYSVLTIH